MSLDDLNAKPAELRECRECHRVLVLNDANFEPVKSSSQRPSWRRVCRECKNAADLARKLNVPESRAKHLSSCLDYYRATKRAGKVSDSQTEASR